MANDVAKCISANDIRNGDTVILGSAITPLNNSSITDQSTSTLIADIEGKYDARFDDATYYGDSGLLTGIVASYRLDELSGVRKDSSGNDRAIQNHWLHWRTIHRRHLEDFRRFSERMATTT